jgi:hypothetical protein
VHALLSLHEVPVSIVHTPFAVAPVAKLHAAQSLATPPPQAELQQTLSTQNPDKHSAALVHPPPIATSVMKRPRARLAPTASVAL